jgi:hypothetical protein
MRKVLSVKAEQPEKLILARKRKPKSEAEAEEEDDRKAAARKAMQIRVAVS